METPEEKKSPIKSAGERYFGFIWEVVKVVIISLAIIIPVRYFLIQPFYVKGASMEPNFHNYEYLVINRLEYRVGEPERGDVVVLRDPRQTGQFFIKRVIGLPGETIEVKAAKVYINDERLDESVYLADTVETYGNQSITLSEDEYFFLGDNRPDSLDSRIVGPITKEEMIGKAWIRAWPFTRLTHFETIDY